VVARARHAFLPSSAVLASVLVWRQCSVCV
jgi:hypothetical protein